MQGAWMTLQMTAPRLSTASSLISKLHQEMTLAVGQSLIPTPLHIPQSIHALMRTKIAMIKQMALLR
jgi:hypothetical protein